MSRLPQPGSDAGSWGDILNDYLSQAHNPDGTLKNNSITSGQLAPGSVTSSSIATGTVGEISLSLGVQTKLNTVGASGSTGATGPQGFTGAVGTDGALGATGVTGPQGPTGVAGSDGANGATGATGPAGSTTIAGISGLQSALDAKIALSEKAAANGVATLDASTKIPASQIPAAPITKVLPYSYLGTLSVSVGTFRLYNDSGAPWVITGARATVSVAPVGAAIIIDVNKNGSTIFTNQANRPTIASATTSSGKVSNMNVTAVADGEYLTVDIDQVGVSVPGNDLVIQLSVA